MNEEYIKNFLGEEFAALEERDEENLFLYTCLELCADAMEDGNLRITDWLYNETVYEDEEETILSFVNKEDETELQIKVTHNGKYIAEIYEA